MNNRKINVDDGGGKWILFVDLHQERIVRTKDNGGTVFFFNNCKFAILCYGTHTHRQDRIDKFQLIIWFIYFMQPQNKLTNTCIEMLFFFLIFCKYIFEQTVIYYIK